MIALPFSSWRADSGVVGRDMESVLLPTSINCSGGHGLWSLSKWYRSSLQLPGKLWTYELRQGVDLPYSPNKPID